ncbi:hypothetical protein [Sporosarcina sp.]|uniref:hypothetical protein n=1 Tax=Sporosarcina sp. TaxID=49982 RepID=UPI002608174B|nr:hypothetical protein [Sporosarcina sp.]
MKLLTPTPLSELSSNGFFVPIYYSALVFGAIGAVPCAFGSVVHRFGSVPPAFGALLHHFGAVSVVFGAALHRFGAAPCLFRLAFHFWFHPAASASLSGRFGPARKAKSAFIASPTTPVEAKRRFPLLNIKKDAFTDPWIVHEM